MDPVHVSQLLAAIQAQPSAWDNADLTIRRICLDSRKVQKHDVFWAIAGANFDGHHFLDQAVAQGAVLCVIDRQKCPSTRHPVVRVEDTRRALGDFARWYRMQHETLVIGVTGSVGKTSTRDLIHTVLSVSHDGVRSRENFNNEIGVPLSLLDSSCDDEFAVVEMGASQVGDIRTLCEIACPEVGVLTKVGIAHLASFGSEAAIFQAKGELLESLPNSGFAVVGGDDDRMRAMAERAACPVIFVGERGGNQVRAAQVRFENGQLRFVVDRKEYSVKCAGRHYLTAALCAIAVGREIGMDPSSIATGLGKYVTPPGRSSIVRVGDLILIDDTYNANPTSVEAAIACLNDWGLDKKRVLVLGDMLELGAEAARLHEQIGAKASEARLTHVVTLGEHAADVAHGAIQQGMPVAGLAACPNLDVLQLVLDLWAEPGAIVLVKGSRGMQMERVVEWLKGRTGESATSPEPSRQKGKRGKAA